MKLVVEACDRMGRKVAETLDADSPAAAMDLLRHRGLFVSSVRPASGAASAAAPEKAARRGGGSVKRLSVFSRQMQMLVSTGTPIVQALDSVSRQIDDARWRKVIEQVRTEVEEGKPLSDALAAHPKLFDDVYCGLIAAGEASGKLPAILARLSALLQKQVHTRNAIVGAMIYPTLLLSVGALTSLSTFLFVVPRFEVMFKSIGAKLPPTTLFLVNASAAVRTYWWLTLLVVVAAVVGVVLGLRSPVVRRGIDVAKVKMPLFGPLVRSFTTARLARLLGVLLDGSVPMVDVLPLVRRATGNHLYAELLRETEEAVTRGEAMSTALQRSPLIEPTVCEAIRSGEQSGKMVPTLLMLADFMDEENDMVLRSLTSLLEPVILIVLGVVVGGVALSLFTPLFDVASMGG